MEEAPHMAKTIVNLCVLGCPLPPYIKEQWAGQTAPVGRAPSRIPTRNRNHIHSRFPTRKRGGRKERERGRRKGGAAPLP